MELSYTNGEKARWHERKGAMVLTGIPVVINETYSMDSVYISAGTRHMVVPKSHLTAYVEDCDDCLFDRHHCKVAIGLDFYGDPYACGEIIAHDEEYCRAHAHLAEQD